MDRRLHAVGRLINQKDGPERWAMKSLIAAMAITLTITAAYAQDAGGMGGGHRRHQQQTSDKSEPKKSKADDKAYQAALKNLPDKPYDPWQSMR
jgi:hypothetical protein